MDEGDGAEGEKLVHLPLIGEFQALNALCAAGIAMALGDPIEQVLDGLSDAARACTGGWSWSGRRPPRRRCSSTMRTRRMVSTCSCARRGRMCAAS